MTRARTLLILVISSGISLLCSSCSSNPEAGGPGSSSGITRTTAIADLTATQAGTLCDWANAAAGGYGRTVTCPDGSDEMSDPDKASCATGLPILGSLCPTLTVGDLEDCANAVGTDLCSAATQSACAAFNACLGG
jgi:hypothetical protein